MKEISSWFIKIRWTYLHVKFSLKLHLDLNMEWQLEVDTKLSHYEEPNCKKHQLQPKKEKKYRTKVDNLMKYGNGSL